ncbi:FAD-dependent oxidoreductase [Cellulomonas sp. PS-H5]|uniref:FAD-dependent oxidoreductase n=1 Tax=Cellulomonas sp. PS-H5 TaxID=2820400 RepID=UPI001C4F82CA|nr:FAD-dependent oxidoreductase [Cellulomonas sp. PS-H5]MBW0254788.1 FAD-dependent oxidoreductase [Cellulomonas sp. PS-H5]
MPEAGPAAARPDHGSGTPGPPGSVVVVGAGIAGARTVLELRAQGFDGRVTLLGAEGVAPYDRPPLSKHLLDRPAPAWLADELGADALAAADDVRLAAPATSLAVDDDGVRVGTAAGDVAADAVVVATGAAAVRPPGWEHAVTLHTAADAERLRAALGFPHGLAATGSPATGRPDEGGPGATAAGTATARRLVVVGAGWVGAEVATVAAAAGVDVTVVEAREAPLMTALGAEVGALTAPWFARAGVRLRTGVSVAAVEAGAVRLADGSVLPADVVLAAIGARPATGWLAGALPLEPDGSVAVDERHAPVGGSWRVRVVGDAARRRSARHGWVPGGHWDAALRGPAVAVAGLLGRQAAESDLAPYVFSTQLGHELALYGLPGAADDVVLRGDPAGEDGWTALWFAPGHPEGTGTLTAVFAVDRPRDVGAARRLLAGAALPVLDRARAADPAVPLAQTLAG